MREELVRGVRVCVVLVNWNAADLTVACIESLLKMTLPPWRIVIFDNGSADGPPEYIAVQFPQVCLLRSETNLGFTGANNAAIRTLLKLDIDYIWVLNNDTFVEPECLEQLVRACELQPQLAAAGAKILHADPPYTIWYAGAWHNRFTFTARHGSVGQPRTAGPTHPCRVDFVTGCSMLIPLRALEQIGLFDDRFFAYNEDFDWCLRACENNLSLLYVPQAVLYHRVSASIGRNTLGQAGGRSSPLAYYLTTRNFLWAVRKHGAPWQVVTASLVKLAQVLGVSTGMMALGRWEKLAAIWRGVRDGLGPIRCADTRSQG